MKTEGKRSECALLKPPSSSISVTFFRLHNKVWPSAAKRAQTLSWIYTLSVVDSLFLAFFLLPILYLLLKWALFFSSASGTACTISRLNQSIRRLFNVSVHCVALLSAAIFLFVSFSFYFSTLFISIQLNGLLLSYLLLTARKESLKAR